MSDALKCEFYAACPIWYWPVLWWQFAVMERYLGDLYAATGKAEMTYGLALGPRGALHLVFLSDTARSFAEGRTGFAEPCFRAHARVQASPPTDSLCNDFTAQFSPAPLRATARLSSPLYLDPG